MSPFGFGRKSPEESNSQRLERLAAERLERFMESRRSPIEPYERAWFEAGALGAGLVADGLEADRLTERAALALDELLTMPLISFWHWQEDQRTGRDSGARAEARAASFRQLQVAYGDPPAAAGRARPSGQERLNDALALDWQFAEEMGSTDSTTRNSAYEALLAERAVALLAEMGAPLAAGMGLPVQGLDELIDRREDRAAFTAVIEFTPIIRAALTASFEAMERDLAEPAAGC